MIDKRTLKVTYTNNIVRETFKKLNRINSIYITFEESWVNDNLRLY